MSNYPMHKDIIWLISCGEYKFRSELVYSEEEMQSVVERLKKTYVDVTSRKYVAVSDEYKH